MEYIKLGEGRPLWNFTPGVLTKDIRTGVRLSLDVEGVDGLFVSKVVVWLPEKRPGKHERVVVPKGAYLAEDVYKSYKLKACQIEERNGECSLQPCKGRHRNEHVHTYDVGTMKDSDEPCLFHLLFRRTFAEGDKGEPKITDSELIKCFVRTIPDGGKTPAPIVFEDEKILEMLKDALLHSPYSVEGEQLPLSQSHSAGSTCSRPANSGSGRCPMETDDPFPSLD